MQAGLFLPRPRLRSDLSAFAGGRDTGFRTSVTPCTRCRNWLDAPWGLVGYGRIGKAVARIARAFGLSVIVHTRRPGLDGEVRFVDRDTLFRDSDVVSLHCPLTPDTQALINEQRLALMKPAAYLLNTGRGPLVNESALARALNEGRLAGAGLDVLSTEPPSADNPLLDAKNCLITPHLGWASVAARRRLMAIVVENVRAFLAGRPQNVVN